MTYVESKTTTQILIYKTHRFTNVEADLWLPKVGEGGVTEELGVSRCFLLHIDEISNRAVCRAQRAMFSTL